MKIQFTKASPAKGLKASVSEVFPQSDFPAAPPSVAGNKQQAAETTNRK
jgi:hypothetical protein